MSFDELKGFDNIGQYLVDDQKRANIISFFDWGFLDKGNFENVRIPSSGQYGGDKHKLQLIYDPNFSKGQVWQSNRANWVWQSGLKTPSIQTSGVYVNGTFYSTSTSGAYSHYIDYPNGRVVFNSPIPASSVVTTEYSAKYINVIDANQLNFVRELQTGSFRIENFALSNPTSGAWANLNRIQSPVVGVEITSAQSFSPYAIGGGQYVNTKVIFHVIAEKDKIATHIATAIGMQNEKTISTFDVNLVSANNRSPLDYRGSIASGALTYPQMVNAFPGRKMWFTNMSTPEGQLINNLYYIPVSCTVQTIIPNI